MITTQSLVGALKEKVRKNWEGLSSRYPKVFFCHVPKCAGTSVSEMIRRRIFPYRIVRTFNIKLQASQRASQASSLDMMSVREIILSYNLSIPQNHYGRGHVYCRPKLVESFMNDWDFITILRNPIDRWISLYVYNTYKSGVWGKNTLPIDDYVLSKQGKMVGMTFVRYFSNMPSNYMGNLDEFVDEAVENLGRFSLVGTVESIEEWCRSFKTYFGKEISIPKKNISPNKEAVDRIRSNDSLMRKIEVLCEPDIRVYQRIVEQYVARDV